jgi:hypothetical protein
LPQRIDLDVNPAAFQEAHMGTMQTAGISERFLRKLSL